MSNDAVTSALDAAPAARAPPDDQGEAQRKSQRFIRYTAFSIYSRVGAPGTHPRRVHPDFKACPIDAHPLRHQPNVTLPFDR